MQPDVEVNFEFVIDKKIKNGYRPAHLIKKDYLTTGVHNYFDNEDCDGITKGTITFISPEDYPGSLWEGKRIEMYEGSKLIGYAIIIKILNTILEKK